MRTWFALVLGLSPAVVFGGDWNPQSAAEYLDSRQKAWFAWKPAHGSGTFAGPCLSCHTGLPYMLARPALRRKLGETSVTPFESGLLDAVRKRLHITSPAEYAPGNRDTIAAQKLGVETILSTLVLAMNDQGKGALSPDTERAFERLWALQIKEGEAKGAWHWNSFKLEPWEEPDSTFYGAALAALAVGVAPDSYQDRPAIREARIALVTYLRSHQATQPLHNRLILAWASTRMRGLLAKSDRKSILDETIAKQEPDGGWTTASLGPWVEHPGAPKAEGSDAYVTGVATYVLRRCGVAGSHPGVQRALAWLRGRQSPEGYWNAQSMNKSYPAGSMQLEFMRDAATGFAALALTIPR